MKRGLFYSILAAIIITHGAFFYWGMKFERSQSEKLIDLTFEAAAQQYKTYQDDSRKHDLSGNTRSETDTLKRVLPKNQRTELAKPTEDRDKKQNDQTQKRNR